jgi:hypothetical protein
MLSSALTLIDMCLADKRVDWVEFCISSLDNVYVNSDDIIVYPSRQDFLLNF